MEPTAMSAVITAMSDVFGLIGTAVTSITGNPILLFFLAASLVPIAFKVFKGAKHAAK